MVRLVIWDAIALIMTSLWWFVPKSLHVPVSEITKTVRSMCNRYRSDGLRYLSYHVLPCLCLWWGYRIEFSIKKTLWFKRMIHHLVWVYNPTYKQRRKENTSFLSQEMLNNEKWIFCEANVMFTQRRVVMYRNRVMYRLEWRTIYVPTRGFIWVLISRGK